MQDSPCEKDKGLARSLPVQVADMTKFVKGNEAVVIGALYAGADVYFGYPITPASEIAHAAADWFPAVGRDFLQAECETASINMLYGAASAGRLAITASSAN